VLQREPSTEALRDDRDRRGAPLAQELDTCGEVGPELLVVLRLQVVRSQPRLEPGDGVPLVGRPAGEPEEHVAEGTVSRTRDYQYSPPRRLVRLVHPSRIRAPVDRQCHLFGRHVTSEALRAD
jgi:hypothetical protein